MSCENTDQNPVCSCDRRCPPTSSLQEGILQAQKSVRAMFNKHIPALKDSEENEMIKRQLIIDTGRQILNCAGLIAIRKSWHKDNHYGGSTQFKLYFELTHVASKKSSEHSGVVIRESEGNEGAALDEAMFLFLKGILLPC